MSLVTGLHPTSLYSVQSLSCVRAAFAMKRKCGTAARKVDGQTQIESLEVSTSKRARPARSRQTGHSAAPAAGRQNATRNVVTSPSAVKTTDTPDDGLRRCQWVGMYRGAAAADYVRYHDEEWGRAVHDDNKLFELLTLEGAQAGLSWSTILAKREAYRQAFEGFDPQKVAAFDSSRLESLMSEGSGVVRHRSKLASAVQNAKVVCELQREHGSFDAFIWSFVPNSQPIVNSWSQMGQVPTKTPEAEELSKCLKKAGMKFVGPTICYAFMQAVGMVNDHTVDCHCYKAILNSCEHASTVTAEDT